MNEKDIKKNCSVVVSSCGPYRDVWSIFFTLFFKYWSDCPFNIYLITDGVRYENDRVKTIFLEKDLGWARNIRYALGKINTPYFIFFIEDYLMRERVNTQRILGLLKYFINKDIDYLRLFPSPGPNKNFDNELNVGEINIDAPYRLSLMVSLWKKDVFLELLKDDENAWQMELVGTERARNKKYKFFSVLKNTPAINYFATGLKKGVWQYDAIKFCKNEGLIVDDGYHKKETYKAYIKRRLRALPVIGRIFRLSIK